MTSLAEVLLGAIGGVPRRCEDSVSTSERPRGLSLSLYFSLSLRQKMTMYLRLLLIQRTSPASFPVP